MQNHQGTRIANVISKEAEQTRATDLPAVLIAVQEKGGIRVENVAEPTAGNRLPALGFWGAPARRAKLKGDRAGGGAVVI